MATISSNLPAASPRNLSNTKNTSHSQLSIMQPSPRRASAVPPSPRRMGAPSPRPPQSPHMLQNNLRRPSPLNNRNVSNSHSNLATPSSSSSKPERVEDSPMSYGARQGQENQHKTHTHTSGSKNYGTDHEEDADDEYSKSASTAPHTLGIQGMGGAKATPSEASSQYSNPSSPFIDLIYSASASTSATPEVFRTRPESDENTSTPVIRNAQARRSLASPSSTLISTTPRNFHGNKEVGIHVPRVAMAAYTNDAATPNSLPSMLGGHDDEDVSALESPVILQFQNSMEESDINSLSQATDIHSMTTTTPSNDSGAFFRRNWRANNRSPEDDSKVEACVSPSLMDIASGSAYFVSTEDVEAAEDDQSTASSTATSVYMASAVKAPGTMLGHHPEDAVSDLDDLIPQPPEEAKGSYSKKRQLFFRTSNRTPSPTSQAQIQALQVNHDPSAGWFLSNEKGEKGSSIADEGDVSELSSHMDRGEQAVENAKPGQRVSSNEPTEQDVEDGNVESKKSSKCGFILRLTILTILALAVIIPLAVILLYTKKSPEQIDGLSGTPLDPTEIFPASPSVFVTESPSAAPVDESIQAPIWVPAPSAAPVEELTLPPFLDSLGDVSIENIAGTNEPSVAPVDFNPAFIGAPPPFSEVWTEDNWTALTVEFGPLWPNLLRREGTVFPTILDSLHDVDASAVLLSSIKDWEASPHLSLTYVKEPAADTPTTIEECVPSSLKIRVCNGNYGAAATKSRVTFKMYLAGRDIVAVVILVNDDYGLDSLSSYASVKRYFCHQLGHSFGVFHTDGGCMVPNLSLDDDISNQEQFLTPDEESFAQLEKYYGDSRRNLRSIENYGLTTTIGRGTSE